jgi:PPM family protein phosphatase
VTAVVNDEAIHGVLSEVPEPVDVVDRMIALANEGGGPDNITCIVADLVEGSQADSDGVRFGAAAEVPTVH